MVALIDVPVHIDREPVRAHTHWSPGLSPVAVDLVNLLRALPQRPRVAVTAHWDHLTRHMVVEGVYVFPREVAL